MINNTSKDIENRLHIKSQPHVSIENPFSKTHALFLNISYLRGIQSFKLEQSQRPLPLRRVPAKFFLFNLSQTD